MSTSELWYAFFKKTVFPVFISTAERFQLCYTNHNVVHVCIVHVHIAHVVLVVVNNLIRAHYNIIMKTTVASAGKLPVP